VLQPQYIKFLGERIWMTQTEDQALEHMLLELSSKVGMDPDDCTSSGLGVSLAVKEFTEARKDLKRVKDRLPDIQVGLVHAFYAGMRGFALEITEAPRDTKITAQSDKITGPLRAQHPLA
jgi:hypothetical protein